jgi:dipeptidyl aminopeptidase/acylaminoacyl peptidase
MENDGEPAWSPDGSKIVFQSWRNDAIPQIYIMNPDGTEQTRITFNAALDSHPAWARIPSKSPIPTNIKIVPKTINLGSKGYFLAFITLSEEYKDATIDMKTVSCSGALAVRMMKMKIFPRTVGFVFKTSELKGVESGKRVILPMTGELKNKGITYTFTGADSVKLIRKPRWQPDDIKDVSKVSDDQLFKQYST